MTATAAETSTTKTGGESMMGSVSQALSDATATASEHATRIKQAASDAGYEQTLSRLLYTGSYVFAFGVVYAAVLVAQSLPQENPVMSGFRDGGRAALDTLARDEGEIDQDELSK